MPVSKSWAEIDACRERLGKTKAELARAAGLPESTIHKGIASGSKPRLGTARVLEQVLESFEEKRDAAE